MFSSLRIKLLTLKNVALHIASTLPLLSLFKSNEEIVRGCYLKILEREPDQIGFQQFLKMMKNSSNPLGINEKDLIKILTNSDEYKKIKIAKIYDSKPPYVFTGSYNIRYLIRPNSILDNTVVEKGVFNRWLCLKLKKLIDKDAIVLDIGANAGLISLPLSKTCVPNGLVYAFEPDNKVASHMKKNIKLNNFFNIIVEEVAVQDNPIINQIILNINRAVQDNGLRNDGLSTIENNSTYKIAERVVKTTTIDNYVKRKNIDRLDFLKIDTEGSEYKVLRGGKKTIKKFRPIIFYEYQPVIGRSVHFKNIEKSFKLLNKMGYKQYFKAKNKRSDLILIKNFSQKLPDGDFLCLYK